MYPKSSYPTSYRAPIGTEHTHLCSAISLEFDRVNLVKSDDARRLVDEDEGLRAKTWIKRGTKTDEKGVFVLREHTKRHLNLDQLV